MRMQAVFHNTVIADSADTVVVEGNHYFPPDSLQSEYVRPSRTRTLCPWKGLASYYDVEVDNVASRNAAWYYPRASFLARRIKGRVAFWNGVQVRAVHTMSFVLHQTSRSDDNGDHKTRWGRDEGLLVGATARRSRNVERARQPGRTVGAGSSGERAQPGRQGVEDGIGEDGDPEAHRQLRPHPPCTGKRALVASFERPGHQAGQHEQTSETE